MRSSLKLVLSLFLLILQSGEMKAFAGGEAKLEIGAVAESFLSALEAGDDAKARLFLSDSVLKQVKPALLISSVASVNSRYGEPLEKLPPRIENFASFKIVFLPRKYKATFLDYKVVFSSNNKVSGFFVVPHKQGYRTPPYVKPGSFREEPLKFGLQDWKLWGKLSIPEGKGPFPSVILVHGSGPQDMDESIGSNKPFMDLAHGLASRGIVVFRYAKRTKLYKLDEAQIQSMTVKDEVIDDVAAAVKSLEKISYVDRSAIFILGHSLGGMLIPRIAQACPDAAGYISLAGASISLTEKLISQTEYLASLGDKSARDGLPELKKQVAEIRALNSADLGASKDRRLILGASTHYWSDLNGYDLKKGIIEVNKPVLFLQGGRDYQVTESGDFELWRKAVASKPGGDKQYQFKLYPRLNHLFMVGVGKSSPDEYYRDSRNVDVQVIEDIARWLHLVAPEGR